MTRLQLYRKVKSLAWRRTLTASLDQLESEIISYMLEKSTNKIIVAGYSVKLIEGRLLLEKMPVSNSKQLQLYFK